MRAVERRIARGARRLSRRRASRVSTGRRRSLEPRPGAGPGSWGAWWLWLGPEVIRKMLRQLKLAANPPPLAPARARHATCDGVASADAVARGCVGDVRAATGCRPFLSVCPRVGHRRSQPPCPRPAPQGTAEALPSPIPSRWSRPCYPWLRAAPAGVGGGGNGAKMLLNFLYSKHSPCPGAVASRQL